MKRRISGILLSMIMVFTMMPSLALPAYADAPNGDWVKLGTAMSGGAQETVAGVFEVGTSGDARLITLRSNFIANGTADNALVVKASADGGKEIILDLNGHTLNRGLYTPGGTAIYCDHGSVIEVEEGGTLTIKDSSANGTITGGTGTLSNGYSGGGIWNYGTLTIEDGNICNNRVSHNGGGIYNIGTLTIEGGNIYGNIANNNGGGMSYYGGEVTIKGGGIHDNFANNNGGGIDEMSDPLILIGGEISANSCNGLGAGVAMLYDIFVGGNAIVKNNYKADNTPSDTQFYSANHKIQISTDNPPQANMHIGFLGDGKITNASADSVNYFFSNDPNKIVKYFDDEGGYLKLVNPTPPPTPDPDDDEDEKIKEEVNVLQSKVNKAITYRNGKIKLTFKALNLSDGTKITKYQVKRSTNKNFKKSLKTYSATCKKTSSKVSFTNSNKLKKGTRYYYKVRGVVELSDGTPVYTKWSKIQSAKCKKTRR